MSLPIKSEEKTEDDVIEEMGTERVYGEHIGGGDDASPSKTKMNDDESQYSPRTRKKRNSLISSNVGLSDEEIDLVLQDLANERLSLLGAGMGKQTWSRYIVENHLVKKKWYNPNIGKPDAPKLSMGWAYFEHFTLPRHFADPNVSRGSALIRAPPGEAKFTELYSTFFTSQSSLSDWGIGMGMYFSTLSSMCIILIFAGLINIANIIYYSSDEYDPGEGRQDFFLLNMLQFSAICTDREWVVCNDCDKHKDRWDTTFTDGYYGTAKDPISGNDTTLINRTTCFPAELQQGMVNFGTLLFLIACTSALIWYLSQLEVRYDEQNSTAADYTIVIQNPPKEALDPEEWRDFFDRFCDKNVTLITIALNNERLLTKLLKRRRILKELRGVLPNIDLDDEKSVEIALTEACRRREDNRSCLGNAINPLLRVLGFALPDSEIWSRLKATTEEIKSLQKLHYHASAVFVTFETEQGQRTALEALNASKIEVFTNKAINIDSSVLFRGTVLNVAEASEPNAVRWMDLSCTDFQINSREFVTFCITFGLVAFSAWILDKARTGVSTTFFSVILSTFNYIIAEVVRTLVAYEKHFDEGSAQASLYIKITFFRWVNTALITIWLTPFLAILGENSTDMINTVNALILSEMFLSPLLRYLDVPSFVNRHYFAPRAKTQEDMYNCFMGGFYNLGERFTDFTKVILLCIFYSAFYPLIYFLGALILFIQYWTDKFLLVRSWKKTPFIGPNAARFSKTYFTTAALVLGAFSSAYAYARSPYTNLCESCTDKDVCESSSQTFTNIALLNGTILDAVDTANENVGFCDQKYFGFPPIGERPWMTPSQESLVRVYGWTSLILFIVYIVLVLGQRIIRAILTLWKGVYKPRGIDQYKDFSNGIGLETYAYIPQLQVPGFHLPFLACNIDDIDVNLIDWRNPNNQNDADLHRSYDDQNLIFDVPFDGMKRSRHDDVTSNRETSVEAKSNPIFSIVKHYPPEWAR